MTRLYNLDTLEDSVSSKFTLYLLINKKIIEFIFTIFLQEKTMEMKKQRKTINIINTNENIILHDKLTGMTIFD